MGHGSVIPALLEKLDNAGPEQLRSSLGHCILHEFVKVLDELECWFTLFCSTRPRTSKCRGDATKDGQNSFDFPDVTTANCMTHYWTFWILCVMNIRQLRLKNPGLAKIEIRVRDRLLDSTTESEITEMATWILQSVDILIQDKVQLFGATSLTLPLKTAYQYLNSADVCNRHSQALCQHMISKLSVRGLFFIVQFIVGDEPLW
jgi:hypothetical protein